MNRSRATQVIDMANWLHKLMPRQESFFPLFNAHAGALDAAAGRLRRLLDSDQPADDASLGHLVDEGRGTADAILAQLRRSFVTPFDRTDIKAMTASMQTLMEDMRSVARTRQRGNGVPLDDFGTLIVECASDLKTGIARLDDFDKHAEELHRMRERIGGRRARMLVLREDALTHLFAHGADDPMAALASNRLLLGVSELVVRFDDVADRIDDLVLDHV